MCHPTTAFGGQLQKLDRMEVIKIPINKNKVYGKTGKCFLHSSSPVPCGVIKATEAEVGLALAKDIAIVFESEK